MMSSVQKSCKITICRLNPSAFRNEQCPKTQQRCALPFIRRSMTLISMNLIYCRKIIHNTILKCLDSTYKSVERSLQHLLSVRFDLVRLNEDQYSKSQTRSVSHVESASTFWYESASIIKSLRVTSPSDKLSFRSCITIWRLVSSRSLV